MNNIKEIVGYRIRQCRKSNELTQEQLAEKIEMTQSYLGGIERGEINISLETLDKVMKALNVTYQEFFNFESINIENVLNKNINKKIVIDLLNEFLLKRDIDEIKMVLRISKDILKTTDSIGN